MKAIAKRFLGRNLKRDFLEKLTEYTIAEAEPTVALNKAVAIVPEGAGWVDIIERGREDLWLRTLRDLPEKSILFLEFGVWRGESMAHFVSHNKEVDSRFFGFDSFQGLPEDWRGTKAEHFDRGGNIPQLGDPRVRFIKGWFRDTLPSLLDELKDLATDRAVVIHFDADLYSSTLYLLFTLSTRFKEFTFIFDEFSGHEIRAMFNFSQATGATADFHYRLDWQGFPQVVSGKLSIP